MIRHLSLALLMFGLSGPMYAQEHPKSKGRKVAFLVGVNNYQGSGLRSFKNAEQDLFLLSLALKGGGYDKVMTLFDSEVLHKGQFRYRPTARNISAELEEFCKTLTEDDTFVFAYSGHSGVVRKDAKVGLQLFPLDVRVTREETMLPLTKIYEILDKNCKAKHKVIFLAPCIADPTDDDIVAFRLAQETCPALPDPPKSVFLVLACKTGESTSFGTKFFLDIADFLSGSSSSSKQKCFGADLLSIKPYSEATKKSEYIKGNLNEFEQIEFTTKGINSIWAWSEYACQNRQVLFENNKPKAVTLPHNSEEKQINYQILKAMTDEVIVNEIGKGRYCEDATFNHDGKLLAVLMPEQISVQVVNAQTGAALNIIKHPFVNSETRPNRVTLVRFSEDGKLLLTGDRYGEVKLTSLEDKKELHRFKHKDAIKAAGFLHGNQVVVTVGDDQIVSAWSIETGKKIWSATIPDRGYCMAISPMRNEIAVGTVDRTFIIINTITGRVIDSVNPRIGFITHIVYSPSGKQLLLCGSSIGVIYDLATSKTTHEFEHERYIAHAAMSSDGSLVATCSPDGFTKIWDAETGRCKHKLKEANSCNHVAFSPDGKTLVGISVGWTHYVWDVQTGKRTNRLIEKKKEGPKKE